MSNQTVQTNDKTTLLGYLGAANISAPTATDQRHTAGNGETVIVNIVKHRSTGERFGKIRDVLGHITLVPVEIMALAAGRDAWMRNVIIACRECREDTTVGNLECGMCPRCFDMAGEENERSDRGQ